MPSNLTKYLTLFQLTLLPAKNKTNIMKKSNNSNKTLIIIINKNNNNNNNKATKPKKSSNNNNRNNESPEITSENYCPNTFPPQT